MRRERGGKKKEEGKRRCSRRRPGYRSATLRPESEKRKWPAISSPLPTHTHALSLSFSLTQSRLCSSSSSRRRRQTLHCSLTGIIKRRLCSQLSLNLHCVPAIALLVPMYAVVPYPQRERGGGRPPTPKGPPLLPSLFPQSNSLCLCQVHHHLPLHFCSSFGTFCSFCSLLCTVST